MRESEVREVVVRRKKKRRGTEREGEKVGICDMNCVVSVNLCLRYEGQNALWGRRAKGKNGRREYREQTVTLK